MNQTRENGKKSSFGPDIFFKNLVSSVTRYYGQLSSSTTSEKTNDPILRKFSDRWTHGQTDEIDFTGRSPTKVERPIVINN